MEFDVLILLILGMVWIRTKPWLDQEVFSLVELPPTQFRSRSI
jgi:hypothetical protein